MPTRKVTNFIVIAVAVLLSAAFVTFRQETAAGSGIYGVAKIGPTCPVVKVGSDCPDKPYQATIDIFAAKVYQPGEAVPEPQFYDPKGKSSYPPVGDKVVDFQTDSSGNFRVSLNPGSYVLRNQSTSSLPSLRAVAVTVTVGKFAKVDLTFDSGLR